MVRPALSLAAILLPPSTLVTAQEVIPVGHFRQLFVDDHVVAERANVELSLQQPTKWADNPVLRADRPWESKGVAIYGTVMYDEQDSRFRMWYRAIDDTCYACYAESEDGIHWEKPSLNAMPHKGSTDNNVVLGGPGFYLDGFAVIKRPPNHEVTIHTQHSAPGNGLDLGIDNSYVVSSMDRQSGKLGI